MITCREAEDLFEPRLDGELSARSEQDLSEHLAGCPACSRSIEREAAVDAAMAAHFADAEPTQELARRILRRIRTEDPMERVGWIADALNAVGGVAMIALTIQVLGHRDPATVGRLLAMVGGALAIGLYPLLLVTRREGERQ